VTLADLGAPELAATVNVAVPGPVKEAGPLSATQGAPAAALQAQVAAVLTLIAIDPPAAPTEWAGGPTV
jgi:hypothetical protein